MKTMIFITILLVILAASLQGQDINNTLGASGVFTIKDGSTTFLTLSQSDGNLSLSNIFTIPVTTASGVGVIFKGADRFIHDFKATVADGNNTFVGVNSGNFTMSGSTAQASYNTAVGNSSLTSLTTGYFNSAFGYESLFSNTTGIQNSAFGMLSLNLNTTGNGNSAFGYQSLYSTGNTGLGGFSNSAFGANSLFSNTTGSENSAFGANSLFSNTTGLDNSAFGLASLSSNTTGGTNSAFGLLAGSGITTGSNNIAIGYNAQVAVGTNSHQIRIGNTAITLATTQIAWTTSSDKRWKSDIVQSGLGLDFVSKLNPVSYTRKNDEKQRTEYGFIAQEIEEVLKEAKVENTGMLTIDDAGMYQLRYNDLLAPMVKAIQELKAENDDLRRELEEMKERQEKWAAGRNNEGTKQRQDETAKVSLNKN